MSKVVPIQVYVINPKREDGVTQTDGVCGIFRTFAEAKATVDKLGCWYDFESRWAIVEDTSEKMKVFLLPRRENSPAPLLVGVIFSEEKERVKKEALSKLTPEEIEALGVKA